MTSELMLQIALRVIETEPEYPTPWAKHDATRIARLMRKHPQTVAGVIVALTKKAIRERLIKTVTSIEEKEDEHSNCPNRLPEGA